MLLTLEGDYITTFDLQCLWNRDITDIASNIRGRKLLDRAVVGWIADVGTKAVTLGYTCRILSVWDNCTN